MAFAPAQTEHSGTTARRRQRHCTTHQYRAWGNGVHCRLLFSILLGFSCPFPLPVCALRGSMQRLTRRRAPLRLVCPTPSLLSRCSLLRLSAASPLPSALCVARLCSALLFAFAFAVSLATGCPLSNAAAAACPHNLTGSTENRHTGTTRSPSWPAIPLPRA
jgi:hypothetical protein